MGRVKTFNEQQVLDEAMMAFWKNGYQSTTYNNLEAATGLTGRSLINAFGDKEAIFEKVLDRYHTQIEQKLNTLFATPGTQAIVLFFEDLACAKRNDPRNNGCLMVNSVFELDKLSVNAKNYFQAFRAMFIEHFEASFNAECIPNAEMKAEFLVTSLWGIASQIRLAGKVSAVNHSIEQVMQLIELWCQEAKAA